MAVKIRLARAGRKKRPFYRIVAVDSRMPRDGRFIEVLGFYDPMAGANSKLVYVRVNADAMKKWLGYGAQMTDRVQWLVKKGHIALDGQPQALSGSVSE